MKTISDSRFSQQHGAEGFTLAEILVAIAIIGILTAIALPSWMGMVRGQQLLNVQDRAYQAMRQAQSSAKRTKRVWEVCFRDAGDTVQSSVHFKGAPDTAYCGNAIWQAISASSVQVDRNNSTLYRKDEIYRVRFDSEGRTDGQLGRIAFMPRDSGSGKTCVFVSTLLGTLRHEKGKACDRS